MGRATAAIPRPGAWRAPSLPFSLPTLLRRELSSVFGLVAAFTVLELAGDYGAYGRFHLDPLWAAIFGVSQEQFIIFSSNAFAILGLRSLYFCLAGMADKFRYLNAGLGVILAFVGVKMILATADVVHLPTWLALAVIVLVLAAAVVASLRADARDQHSAQDVVDELVERSGDDPS